MHGLVSKYSTGVIGFQLSMEPRRTFCFFFSARPLRDMGDVEEAGVQHDVLGSDCSCSIYSTGYSRTRVLAFRAFFLTPRCL